MILSAAAFALRLTVHLMHQKPPGQLVFGRDMMLNIKHEANWDLIGQRKQDLINKNNLRENSKRTPHSYKDGDKVLVWTGIENKWETPQKGPFVILESFNNGTMSLRKGPVTDIVNIRRLTPFFETSKSSHGGECSKQASRSKRKAVQAQTLGIRII